MTIYTAKRPYMLRAQYEWMMENMLTPHIVVDATIEGSVLPMQFVEDNQIILNIGVDAVIGLQLGNESIRFNARFGGKPMQVVAPLAAVRAIYARENGEGMMFEPEAVYEISATEHEALFGVTSTPEPEPSPEPEQPKPAAKVSHLRVVK